MFELPVLLPFLITCLVIESTPGPNMAYLAILSANDGRRAGLAAVAGVALGLLAVGIAAAMGVAALIEGSPFLYELLRWGGVAYLLWLAWDGWHQKGETSPAKAIASENIKFFRRGLVTNLLNPKAAIFYIAVLPGFTDASYSIMPQTIALTVIYVSIATCIHATIVVLAGSARPFLEDPARSRLVRRTLSLALAGIALWFGWSTAA